MSTPETKKTFSLDDYLDLLQVIYDEGLSPVVIGGLAVNSYGRLIGETVLSGDLDLYASRAGLDAIVNVVQKRGVKLTKRPKARSIPVAFFEWKGKEVNVLISAPGLRDPDAQALVARSFERPGLSVLVVDPFDLLQNKLSVDRAKDRPHVPVIKRFLEEEIVQSFQQDSAPRERIGPAQRYLQVTRSKVLEEGLAARLVPLARPPVDFRFLLAHVPTRDLAQQLIDRAEGTALRQELEEIRKKRRFPR